MVSKITAIRSHLVFTLLALTGCASSDHRSSTWGITPLIPISGVWDFEGQTTDLEQDERIERHEWQFQQHGNSLAGFLDRSITWISKGPLFACNRRQRFTQFTRYLLTGKLHPEAVLQLSPLYFEGAQCPPAEAPLQTCHFSPHQGKAFLLLDCGDSSFVIARRLDQPIPLALAFHQRGAVTGVWIWHHRSVDEEGDTKLEDETWHLQQEKQKVYGYYDRRVTIQSRDGRPFKCNNRLQYANQTRFRLEGAVSGSTIRFRELDYFIRAGSCENGKRKLDQYTGNFHAENQTLKLSWGKGAQILYRRY